MSYKTELQGNNNDLQSILDMILGLGLVDAPPPIITLTISGSYGTSFQFEEGMTWEEWINSDYNTISAYISYETIKYMSGSSTECTITKEDNTSVTSTDLIIADYNYGYEKQPV